MPFVQGSINIIELPVPLPGEPENLEFFADFDVPLECSLADSGALANERKEETYDTYA